MKVQNGISLSPLPAEAKAAEQDARLKEAAKMYEGHFLNEMVKAMRSTVNQEDGITKPNFAEKIFTEQLDQQYVDNWAAKGGVGLADLIYNQLRDQYMGETHKQIHQPDKHFLPVNPKSGLHGVGVPDSMQMKMLAPAAGAKLSYRFSMPSPATDAVSAQAPMDGRVLDLHRLAEGWNSVRLDHGDGLTSEMTFPGSLAPFSAGDPVKAGQKLGVLDPARPTLAWNLDWT